MRTRMYARVGNYDQLSDGERKLKYIADVVNSKLNTVHIGAMVLKNDKLEYAYGVDGIGPFVSIKVNGLDNEQIIDKIINNIMSVEYIAKGEKEFKKFSEFISRLAEANNFFEGRNIFEFAINAVDIYCEVYDLPEYKEVFKEVYRRRYQECVGGC